ncbi:MAG: hypothetical protein DRI24_18195 [Deltaproteobacteria bacterium]|nr:MAG: hypothetical protein DRI24_18195 [Deltaproteobacteria bacterium]
MKIIVTLDAWRSEDSKQATMDAEELPVRQLMMQMMSGKIAGFSVTKAIPLTRLNDPKFGLTESKE